MWEWWFACVRWAKHVRIKCTRPLEWGNFSRLTSWVQNFSEPARWNDYRKSSECQWVWIVKTPHSMTLPAPLLSMQSLPQHSHRKGALQISSLKWGYWNYQTSWQRHQPKQCYALLCQSIKVIDEDFSCIQLCKLGLAVGCTGKVSGPLQYFSVDLTCKIEKKSSELLSWWSVQACAGLCRLVQLYSAEQVQTAKESFEPLQW